MISVLKKIYKDNIKNISCVLLARVFQQLINIVAFFFIIRLVPKDVIGEYHFVLSIVSLLSIFSLPGFNNGILQSISRGDAGFFKLATKYKIFGSLMASVILIILSYFYFYFYLYLSNISMAYCFILSAISIPFYQGLLHWKSTYLGREEINKLSFLELLCSLVQFSLLGLCAFIYSDNYILLVFISLSVPSMQNIIMYLKEREKYKIYKVNDDMVSYSLKTSKYQVLPIISSQIDRLSVYGVLSPSDLIIYNLSLKFSEFTKNLIQDLAKIAMPKFARMPTYTKKTNDKINIISIVIGLLILLFTYFIFPFVYRFLTPEDYYDYIYLSQILLVSVSFSAFSIFKGNYIKSQKDSKGFKNVIYISTLSKIITSIPLVYFFGLLGAVFSIFIQRVIIYFGTEFLLRKNKSKM